jgi:hypothetical protein
MFLFLRETNHGLLFVWQHYFFLRLVPLKLSILDSDPGRGLPGVMYITRLICKTVSRVTASCVYPEGLAKSSEMIDVWVDGLVWWVRTATPTPSLTDDHRDPAEGGLGEEIIARRTLYQTQRKNRELLACCAHSKK